MRILNIIICSFFLLANIPLFAERFYLESSTPTNLMIQSPIASTTSCGSISSDVGTAPHDTKNQYFLVESSLGYPGPVVQAGLNTRNNLVVYADTKLSSATSYKNNRVGNNWDIIFPGVIDISTGNQVLGDQNFHPEYLQQAIDYYRAIARAYPSDIQARINFINSLIELLVPYSYAGNNSYARAVKERLLSEANFYPASKEEGAYRNALSLYEIAIQDFIDINNNDDSYTAAFSNELISFPNNTLAKQLDEKREQLCTTYARVLQYKGEAVLKIYQLLYFKNYNSDNISGTTTSTIQNLIKEINDYIREMVLYSLIVEPLANEPWFPIASFSSTSGYIANLNDLKYGIQNSFLTFVGLKNSSQLSTPQVSAHIYASNYVPIYFDQYVDQHTRTFSALYDLSSTLIKESVSADAKALTSTDQVEMNLQAFAQRYNNIYQEYHWQLGNLCGFKTVTDFNGKEVVAPDFEGAILPIGSASITNPQGEIGQQKKIIQEAELALLESFDSLDRIFQTIDIKRETWRKIKDSREDMIQNVILSTGEKLAQLEKDRAEVQAKHAEYKAELEKKKRKSGLVSGIIGVGLGVFTGGISAVASSTVFGVLVSEQVITIATALKGISDVSNAYSNASNSIKSIQSEAQMHRALGEIEAKKVELQTMQTASMQFQQIDEEGYRLEESISQLLIQVKSTEIQIEIAKLRVESEYAKLGALYNRVAFLTQQFADAYKLENRNPLNSPDYRIERDIKIRNAEDRFVYAQEWVYLASRSALYMALGVESRNNISTISNNVLKARTGEQLSLLLENLNTEVHQITLNLGGTNPDIINVSLRDYIFQNNNVNRNAYGEISGSTTPKQWEPYYLEDSEGNTTMGATEEISDQAWYEFLKSNIVEEYGIKKLKLEFGFTLGTYTQKYADAHLSSSDIIENPFFSNRNYGSIIFFSTTAKEDFYGTRVDILGREIEINSENETVKAILSCDGISYIRARSYGYDNKNDSDNVLINVLEPVTASINCSINGFPQGRSNQQLTERSPANSHWTLVIEGDSNSNRKMLNQIDKIKDIRLSFSLKSYIESQ